MSKATAAARESALGAAFALRRRIARSKRAKRLLYELRNRRVFADFFQHDRMLADRIRIDSYWSAIEKHVGPGDVVVDLGTGTGVLSFFAAKQGARVHAIEHGPIIATAEAVARANGIDGVEFHRANSRAVELEEKCDVIIHEQIGDALFDERVIDNVADLRDRLLKPGGMILPAHLDLYIEPVELSPYVRSPFVWQQQIHGIDFGAVEEFAELSHAYLYRGLRPFPYGQLLCEPRPVCSVDLHTAVAGDLPRTISYRRPATSAGNLDGFCVYFAARFDDEIGFDTSPASPGTSWATPWLRTRSRPVEIGAEITLELEAEDLADPDSWSWNLNA